LSLSSRLNILFLTKPVIHLFFRHFLGFLDSQTKLESQIAWNQSGLRRFCGSSRRVFFAQTEKWEEAKVETEEENRREKAGENLTVVPVVQVQDLQEVLVPIKPGNYIKLIFLLFDGIKS